MREFSEQEQVRRDKLGLLEEHNIGPFGERFERNTNTAKIKKTYGCFSKEE